MYFVNIEERKDFVILLTKLLIIVPIMFLLISVFRPEIDLFEKIIYSFFPWNFIGTSRIDNDWEDDYRDRDYKNLIIALLILLLFPFVYLYHVLYLLFFKE